MNVLARAHRALGPRGVRTFVLTWLSYAGYYLTRQNLSAVKDVLQSTFDLTKRQLGHLDTGYLAAYAGGQVLWGFVTDRVGARRVLAFGMMASAALSVAFGLTTVFWLLVVLWTLNGVAQATGWPANVQAMTRVATAEKRGLTMGIWGTNYVVGGLGGPALGALCLSLGGLGFAFIGPAAVVGAIGLLLWFALPDTGVAKGASDAERAAAVAERRAAYRVVLRTPRVWLLGASYFFMKLTRYALLFWLPYYGKTALDYTRAEAVGVSLAFQVGGVVGSVGMGVVSDRWLRGRRIPMGIASLLVLAVVLSTYGWASRESMVLNFVWLSLIGITLFGPDSIVCGAAAQDLGGKAAAAAAAGIINGIGSIGPVFGLEFWNGYSDKHGWDAAFLLLGLGSLAAAVLVAPLWRLRAAEASSS